MNSRSNPFTIAFSTCLVNRYCSFHSAKLAFTLILLTFFACKSPNVKREIDLKKPTVVSAEKFVAYAGSLSSPEIIPAGEPRKVKISQKKNFPGH